MIELKLKAGARVLATTPAAGKLYRGREGGGYQSQDFKAIISGEGAVLEYFPQETIVFSGARGIFNTSFILENESRLIFWNVVCLGRPESGESFRRGSFKETLTVVRDGRTILRENLLVFGSEDSCGEEGGLNFSRRRSLKSSLSLFSLPVYSLFLAAGRKDDLKDSEAIRSALESLKEITGPESEAGPYPRFRGATLKDGLLLVRSVGESVMEAKSFNLELWARVRPFLLGKDPEPPRVWRT
jgi:urease accessory protein